MNTAPQSLVSVAYARIATPDPLASARFAEEIVGLQRAGDEHDDVALRADDRSRSLVFAQAIEPSLGVEAWDDATLDACESRLNAAHFPARRASLEESRARRVQAALIARDATGNAIEIVVRPERSGTRFFGCRDAGILGLFGVGLRSTDRGGDLRFWRTLAPTSATMSARSPISLSTGRIIESRSTRHKREGCFMSPSKSPRSTT